VALCRLTIVSDIHYAGAAERARVAFCSRSISHPLLRLPVRFWQRFIWEPDPLGKSQLLGRFLEEAPAADLTIANGDYSCDSAFVGVSDDATFQSVFECLGKLRERCGSGFHGTIGDHELGKIGFGTQVGGLRLESYRRTVDDLKLAPFWRIAVGRYVLMGVTSSLLALPVYQPEAPAEEHAEWERLREVHLAEIRRAFVALESGQRVLLFCHDPSALPFLWREDAVRSRLGQVEQTIVGHLHSNLIWQCARMLTGVPRIGFLGPFARRVTAALGDAKHWRPFKVRLCPALRGIELLKDGGYFTAEIGLDGNVPARFTWHPLAR
jgi:hypothetical protein